MVKFSYTDKDGKTRLGFGLSEENIKRLKAGKPILVNLAEMGLEPVELMIFYGVTEEEIAKEIEPYIGPKTKIQGMKD